jgi:hypothetical protein
MSGSISSASMASGSNVAEASGSGTQPLLGAQENAGAAAFQDAARQTSPAPVEVRRTESFCTPAGAARHALAQANPVSIREDVEYGGNLYSYRNWLGCTRYGYTGPERGRQYGFSASDPAVLPPPNSQLVGDYHTHGAYYAPFIDRETGSVNFEDNTLLDRFSTRDLEDARNTARGLPGETAGERELRITDLYGVPPVPSEQMRFYLAGPDGIPREHIPARPPSREETVARNHETDEPIPNGGTVRVLPVVVRGTEAFCTPADAARHALARTNPLSIREDKGYGGLLYRYHNRLGRERFGYTGPVRDGTDYHFDAANPAVRPPGYSQLVGIYQTQGAYTQFDPTTDSVNRFSVNDLTFQRDIALGVPDESREEREHDIRDTYGVPPAPQMQFYIAGPGNVPREHIPVRPPSRDETAARNPVTDERIENGGTDRVLRRQWWHRLRVP